MSSWLLHSNFTLQVLVSSKHLCFVYEILSWLELSIPASSLVISTSVSLFPWALLQQNWLLNWVWGTVLNLGLYLEHFWKFQMKYCSSNCLQVMKVNDSNLSFYFLSLFFLFIYFFFFTFPFSFFLSFFPLSLKFMAAITLKQ